MTVADYGEAEDDDDKPSYLSRGKVVDPTSQRQREKSNALLKGNTTHVGEKPVEKWHPTKLDHNGWRKTSLDDAYG